MEINRQGAPSGGALFIWYRPGRHFNRLSCGGARRIVSERGYRNVVARNCSGETYVFRAVRNYRVAIVYVNARTGAVWRG